MLDGKGLVPIHKRLETEKLVQLLFELVDRQETICTQVFFSSVKQNVN